jgi:hypothetical protein
MEKKKRKEKKLDIVVHAYYSRDGRKHKIGVSWSSSASAK